MRINALYLLATFSLAMLSSGLTAVTPDQKKLPIGFAPHETTIKQLFHLKPSSAPSAPIRSLAEWESSDGVMTLWTNPSWVRALAQRGPVKLLADDNSSKQWWANWLRSNNIPASNISYFVVPTDSIWIRDYGPWFILDGAGTFGIVDTKYNRPRAQDDRVPEFIGTALNVPVFKPGLVHTGGNYYNDGLGNAFSSTLVYSENSNLSTAEVQGRMKSYLGIDRYTTSPLAPGLTIEHMDTFGKLVSPDTWVFSDFPANSKFRADSEKMVALLKTLKSPFGTPYKIFRMPMTNSNGADADYRAYINSFISNHTLYYPIYNTSADLAAKKIYEEALPGYEVVGVDALGTEWGDSVHCRSRNVLSSDTLFVFPRVANAVLDATQDLKIEADVFASPGADITSVSLHWSVNGKAHPPIPMSLSSERTYTTDIPAQAPQSHIAFHVVAADSSGKTKTAPAYAPLKRIELDVN